MKKLLKTISIMLLLISVVAVSIGLDSLNVMAEGDYSEWTAIFDPEYYKAHCNAANAYAGDSIDKLWEYFLKVGIPNKDQACEEFNVDVYMSNYPDLVKLYGNNYISYYIHYAKTGKAAGLNGRTLLSSSTTNTIKAKNYPEGYIVIGEGYATELEKAALSLANKTGKIKGFESAVYPGPMNYLTGNLFFICDDSKSGKDFIYSDGISKRGPGVSKIHSIIDANPRIKHWNIISLHGQNVGSDNSKIDNYVVSYGNWIFKEFPDADIFVLSQNVGETSFNARLKDSLGRRYIDFAMNYSSLDGSGYEKLLVNMLTKVRQLRVSAYSPNEVGFLILSECHSDVLLWSAPHFIDDSSIETMVPKYNIVPVSAKSHNYPNYFGGGVTVTFEGLKYEADSIINGLMKEHPNVKFWYIVYFAGSNYIRNSGSESAMKYVRTNLYKIANKDYYAENTIALMTTPPMYNRGLACEKLVNTYDDAEMEYMKTIGYSEYAYDTRDDFNSYVSGHKLKKDEFEGYSFGNSGDGLHFYGKQYWQVTANAINAIYKKSRGE